MIKLKVREQLIRYVAAKKAKILKREELEKAINRLQIIIDTTYENETPKTPKQEMFTELER